jgi:hypothetical protein
MQEVSSMDKLNIPFFYQLGTQLNPLTKMKVESQNQVNILIAAYPVRNSINSLLNWSGRLKVCHASARAFITAIDVAQKKFTEAKPEDATKNDTSVNWAFQQVIDKAKTFETVLSEELLTISAYSASQKGIYSTSDLIDQASNIFPPSVLGKLSQSIIQEVNQAGRCLAFDISTATGFHMLRATEEVLHKYYLIVCEPKVQSKLDSWGAYIAALYKLTEQESQAKENVKNHVKKVLALLQQIKDQDRNIIMHPEISLSEDEAFILFEITKSSILAMADKLPINKPGAVN